MSILIESRQRHTSRKGLIHAAMKETHKTLGVTSNLWNLMQILRTFWSQTSIKILWVYSVFYMIHNNTRGKNFNSYCELLPIIFSQKITSKQYKLYSIEHKLITSYKLIIIYQNSSGCKYKHYLFPLGHTQYIYIAQACCENLHIMS